MKYIKRTSLIVSFVLYGFSFPRDPETNIQFKDIYDNGSDPPSIENSYRMVVDNCFSEPSFPSLICDWSLQYEGIFGSDKVINIHPENGVHTWLDMEVFGAITVGSAATTLIDNDIITRNIEAADIKSSQIVIENPMGYETITISGGDFDYPYIDVPSTDGAEGAFIDPTSIYLFSEFGGFSLTTIDATSITTGTVITETWEIEPADYVFEPDYELPPLSQIESFVKKHKHLPEIPSGKEMKANGLDLGTMNILLLKKVEELTLYSIEQEKNLKKQQKRIDRMEKLITRLQKENEGERYE